MKNLLLLLVTFPIVSSCFTKTLDIQFIDEELQHFADYKKGNILYYVSTHGDVDTIQIMGYEEEINNKIGGFINPRPMRCRWVTIAHLPKDKWHSTHTYENNESRVAHQVLLSVCKFPLDTITEYFVQFKDFCAYGPLYSDLSQEPLTLNHIVIDRYYKIHHSYPHRIKDSTDIEFLYWTDKDGLVAYQNKGGEIWTKNITKK